MNCEVLEVAPHKRLRYTWKVSPVDTVVTWTLTPTPSGGTKLALEHSGFQPGNAFEGAQQGWQRMAGEALPRVLAQI